MGSETSIQHTVRVRLDGVQAGRGIAALLVTAFHASGMLILTKYIQPPPVASLFAFGHAGVDFFFVLSGFIITNAHHADIGRRGSVVRYATRRFARIYPIYWLVTGALCIYMSASPLLRVMLSESNLVSSFLLLPDSQQPLLGVAWTLRAEILFYIAFGFAIIDARLVKPQIAIAIMLVGIGAVGAAPGERWTATFVSPFNLEFLLGIWAARILDRGTIPKPFVVMIMGIFAFASFGLLEDYTPYLSSALVGRIAYGGASMMILLGVVACERRGRLAVSRPFVVLGDTSYSLYLIHFPVIGLALKVYSRLGVFTSIPPALILVSLIVFPIIGGVAVHWWLEAPLIRFVSKSLSRFSASPARVRPTEPSYNHRA